VTFAVSDERFRVLITNQALIDNARGLLAGQERRSIPTALVVRGDDGGVNAGHQWHLDPASLQFADVTTETCDGRPSDVDNAASWTSERYCPWTAKVISVEVAS
jgi:hypothetical protein